MLDNGGAVVERVGSPSKGRDERICHPLVFGDLGDHWVLFFHGSIVTIIDVYKARRTLI